MSMIELLSSVLLLIGAAFFFAGTVALLRFPDVYTRLHALAKADNLGLGFTVLGLIVSADSIYIALRLFLIWFLVLVASSAVSFLVARRARRHGIAYWHEGNGRT